MALDNIIFEVELNRQVNEKGSLTVIASNNDSYSLEISSSLFLVTILVTKQVHQKLFDRLINFFVPRANRLRLLLRVAMIL